MASLPAAPAVPGDRSAPRAGPRPLGAFTSPARSAGKPPGPLPPPQAVREKGKADLDGGLVDNLLYGVRT